MQTTTLGGDNHATTRWIITLLSKENGTIVIPPLQVGDYSTQPISLQVVETASQNTNAELAPVFVEANLDQSSVYVQAQALLTVRVYHSVSLYDDSSLTAPDNSRLWLWQLSTLILACSTLLGFGLWWRARRQPAVLRAAQTGPSPRTLLDDLMRATQANAPRRRARHCPNTNQNVGWFGRLRQPSYR